MSSEKEMEQWELDANAKIKKMGATELWTHDEYRAFTDRKTMFLTDLR